MKIRWRNTPKRIFDVAGAAILCVLLGPFLVVIAVAVALGSGVPVLYFHQRIGRDGVAFSVWKFRTMQVGTDRSIWCSPESLGVYVDNDFKLPFDDARITKVGRWLRKSSFDELPQLVNVLRGEMSLIGPRPLVATELARRSVADQEAYRAVRPGMTGLWQVEGRSRLDEVDRIALDRRYAEECSMALDLSILRRTPGAILRTAETE